MSLIETTFVCGLDQVSLPKTTRQGSEFLNDYYITKAAGRVLELVKHFDDSLGSLEMDYLLKHAKAVVYRKTKLECSNDSEDIVAKALGEQLIKDMLAIKVLDSALWMIKDNACHFDRAWIAGTINGQTTVNNNVWAARHTCADGLYTEVAFSFDEFRLARSLRRPIGVHLKGNGAPTLLSKDLLRFQRFEYFVGAARASVDVAIKIAQYCSGLEALVSTSQQELSHQVSERVAAVLVKPGPKRVEIFQLVKKAYGFRSKAVHGASFKSAEIEQLRVCSRNVDQICRTLQALYFDSDPCFRSAVEASGEKSSDFFIEAILGGGSTQDRAEIDLVT